MWSTSPVEFILSTTVHELDIDGNGLYDFLILELNVHTTAPGWYRLTGELYILIGEENGVTETSFHTREFASTVVYLNETTQVVTINFEGGRIRNKQIHEPYEYPYEH